VTSRPDENRELIRRVLGKDYLELALKRLSVEEEPDAATRVKVIAADDGRTFEVEGSGVGLVDALFAGLLGRFAVEYQSLKSVQLANFHVDANIDSKKVASGVDAVGTVTIEVRNSEGRRFRFADASRSVTTSTARAVLAIVEYFVNAEKAFITLFNARKDAIERNRFDLVTRYTEELAELVQSTSYTEVIEAMKKQIT
jgi:hypothetical protein